jgi:pyruvate/2-oxoglutarate dehydrogenase complex dihydrolipoamide acyltransferase (E2) component
MSENMYEFNWRYRSDYGNYDEGQIVQLDDEFVDFLNRDSPGVVKPYDANTRAPKKPVHHRMMTAEDTDTRQVEATAAAVSLAEDHGIDIDAVKGSGRDGKILKADVEALIG